MRVHFFWIIPYLPRRRKFLFGYLKDDSFLRCSYSFFFKTFTRKFQIGNYREINLLERGHSIMSSPRINSLVALLVEKASRLHYNRAIKPYVYDVPPTTWQATISNNMQKPGFFLYKPPLLIVMQTYGGKVSTTFNVVVGIKASIYATFFELFTFQRLEWTLTNGIWL